MTWGATGTLIATLAVVAGSSADEGYRLPGNTVFLHDYEEGLALTRQNGLPLLVYFAAKPFEVADRTYFTDPKIERLLERFNRVYVLGEPALESFTSFSISQANPTFVVLNDLGQNIHRWAGWMRAPVFAERLEMALRKHELYLSGEEWIPMAEPAGSPSMSMNAPFDGQVIGMAFLRGLLWCLQRGEGGTTLTGIDRLTGEVVRSLDAPFPVATGLTAADGTLYVLQHGWSKGDPILGLDPDTGEIVSRVVTKENLAFKESSAHALAGQGPELFVYDRWTRITRINRETGEIITVVHVWSNRYRVIMGSGMEHDGEHLVVAGTVEDLTLRSTTPLLDDRKVDGLLWIDPETGEIVNFVPTEFPVAGIVVEGAGFLLADREVRGFNKSGGPVRLSPDRMRIHHFRP